jgi:hypothetical protein
MIPNKQSARGAGLQVLAARHIFAMSRLRDDLRVKACFVCSQIVQIVIVC